MNFQELSGYGLAFLMAIGNAVQWFFNRKRASLETQGQFLDNQAQTIANLEKQLTLIQDLQTASNKTYEEALAMKDLQIKRLTEQVETQQKQIVQLTDQISKMEKILNTLFHEGCKDLNCSKRKGYSVTDINTIVDGLV